MRETEKSTNTISLDSKKAEFEDEFDEYDLLKSDVSSAAGRLLNTDLTGTTKAFNTRIQRKKREQEEAQGIANKQTRLRHNQMFTALVSIRKSLRDITRIDLGDRFSFSLIADDCFGWPRFSVRLLDAEQTSVEYPPFTVSAHDRNGAGNIEICYSQIENPEKISVENDQEIKRLAAVLRKCVRFYLDIVGDIVLQAEQQGDVSVSDSEDELPSRKLTNFEETTATDGQSALTGDLFEEELGKRGVLDTLPSLEEIDLLPDLPDPNSKRDL